MVETEYTGGSSLIDRENGTRTPYVCTLPDRRSLGVENGANVMSWRTTSGNIRPYTFTPGTLCAIRKLRGPRSGGEVGYGGSMVVLPVRRLTVTLREMDTCGKVAVATRRSVPSAGREGRGASKESL